MLVIQMPDNEQRRAKRRTRRLRALGYLIAGLLIVTALGVAFTRGPYLWYPVFAVESWWLWACWTDPGMQP